MSALFAAAIAAAQRAQAHVLGGPIVYARGEASVEISATFGRSEFVVESSGSVRTEHTDRDFLFLAAALILGGAVTTPRKGDRITVGSEVFEALPVDGQQCFRPSDSQGLRIRVFTKKVGNG